MYRGSQGQEVCSPNGYTTIRISQYVCLYHFVQLRDLCCSHIIYTCINGLYYVCAHIPLLQSNESHHISIHWTNKTLYLKLEICGQKLACARGHERQYGLYRTHWTGCSLIGSGTDPVGERTHKFRERNQTVCIPDWRTARRGQVVKQLERHISSSIQSASKHAQACIRYQSISFHRSWDITAVLWSKIMCT